MYHALPNLFIAGMIVPINYNIALSMETGYNLSQSQ